MRKVVWKCGLLFEDGVFLGEGFEFYWDPLSTWDNPRDFYPGLIEGPSLFGQPLLPGTVVGEASMKAVLHGDNITAGGGRRTQVG